MSYTKPQYPVDTTIPLPAPRAPRKEYPFGCLAAGDSYAFPSVEAPKHRAAADAYRSRADAKGKTRAYTCQRIEGTDQHRLWRTA